MALVSKAGFAQLKVCMDEPVYVKIACASCSEHVEFPLEMRGHIINCPHCTLSLVLELPGAPQTPPPANLYQRLRALNGLDAKPVDINLPPAFMQNPQARP
jgi:DNA-directed RNA polymerase subunit RPC12/RpoP